MNLYIEIKHKYL